MSAPVTDKTERRPNLPAAVRRLREAISRLLDPAGYYRSNTYIEVPGLYVQLTANLAGLQQSKGRSHFGSAPTLWVDAVEQKQNIDFMVTIWPTGAPADANTIARLRALAAKTWTVEDVKVVRRLAGIVAAWADDITILLEPEHIKHLAADCPACGAATVQKRDSAGEYVRSPALQIITEQGCTCQNCETYWAPNQYIELCKELGIPLPDGVLE